MATTAIGTKRIDNTGSGAATADRGAEDRSHNWLQPISTGLLAAVILVVGVAGGGYVAGMWRFATIDTGSMHPTLNPGDVAILRPEPLSRLHVGQVVAFRPPGMAALTVIHRVVAIDRGKSGDVIQTKGDANNARDQWKAHLLGNTVWYQASAIPKIGYLVVWAQIKVVRLAALIGIVVLALSLGLQSLWRREPDTEVAPRAAA